MTKKRIILTSAIIGMIFGYVVLSPITMLFADRSPEHFQDMHHRENPVTLLEIFKTDMLFWTLPFMIFGGIAGVGLGLFYGRIEEQREEKRKLEHQLFRTEKLASTGKLAASIAHEVNNPLFGIKNCIYLLMDEIDDGDSKKKYLNMADKELDRITNIVRQLLDFHRPAIATMESTNINTVMKDVLSLVKNQLTTKKIKVSRKLDPRLPKIMASPEQLKQVFLNLILNAQEAMPKGGELEIKTGTENRSLQIEFTDTGFGIPEDEIAHLFDPFFTKKKETKGMGLGLSISHGIIRAHNGRIDVKSKVGEGSTFTITLPIK